MIMPQQLRLTSLCIPSCRSSTRIGEVYLMYKLDHVKPILTKQFGIIQGVHQLVKNMLYIYIQIRIYKVRFIPSINIHELALHSIPVHYTRNFTSYFFITLY